MSERIDHIDVNSGDVLVALGTASNKCIFRTCCATGIAQRAT
jgi:hypothetical protein